MEICYFSLPQDWCPVFPLFQDFQIRVSDLRLDIWTNNLVFIGPNKLLQRNVVQSYRLNKIWGKLIILCMVVCLMVSCANHQKTCMPDDSFSGQELFVLMLMVYGQFNTCSMTIYVILHLQHILITL